MSRAQDWLRSPAGLFCCLSLLLCVDQLLGPYALVRFHDWFDIVVFSERNLARDILQHGLTSWMPSIGGMPSFVAHKPPYDLVPMLMAVLPPWLVNSLMSFLVFWATGAGMERLLREYFGLHRRVAFLGGILFVVSCNGLNIMLFVSFLPLFFLCFLDLYRSLGLWRRARAVLLLLLMTVFSLPVISLMPYSILHFLLVLVFHPRRGKLTMLGATVLLWTLYALYYLPVFWGLWDYLPDINRVYSIPPTSWSLKSLRRILDLLRSVNSFTPIMALAICCLPQMLRDTRVRWAGAVLLFYFAVTVTSMMPEWLTLIHGTFLEKIDFYHFLTPLPFLFVFFIALALDAMVRAGQRPSALWLGLALALTLPWLALDYALRALFFLLVGLAAFWPPQAQPSSLLPAFLGRRPGLLRGLAAASVAGVFMISSAITFMDFSHVIYARAFESVPELQALARETRAPFRVGSLDLAPCVALSNGLETVVERKILFNRHYKQYVLAASGPQFVNATATRRDSAFYSPTELYLRFPQDSFTTRRDAVFNRGLPLSAGMLHLPMLQAINMQYILSPKPVAGLESQADSVRLVRGGGVPPGLPAWLRDTALTRSLELPVYIYHLRETFERAYVVGTPVVLESSADVDRELRKQSVDDLRRKAFFTRDDVRGRLPEAPLAQAKGAPTGLVTRIAPGPDAFTIEGTTNGPALVVVTNNWDKNWRALLNGSEAPVLRCNLAFQAVAVPGAGPFRLELEYHNPRVWWLHLASGAAVLGLLALAFWFPCPRVELPGGGSFLGIPPHPRGGSRPVLLGGLGMTGLWSVIFLLTRALREPAASPRPVLYILAYTALIGVLLTFWWLRAEDLCQNQDHDK
ncbi:MAG: hypothetical protein CVU73_15395 [Deltaproteobacteria bacterium HGW-Deltaproteobacteria-8]|jgi:hypothetical protein|nr:MAG: hypothetical protein CVU73_15395 [Deltaproteobacteria bacterium HGW-Deltaproteobacteria-8]